MPKLSDPIKAEIVTMLARFCSASDVIRTIEVEFGVQVDRFQVRTYDPSKAAYAAGDKWRDLFSKVRSAYVTEIEPIPIAHKAYRLNQLQRSFDIARERGNLVLASAMLEQAAKEVGGALTNTQTVSVTSSTMEMTAEERREKFTELVRKALDTADSKQVN